MCIHRDLEYAEVDFVMKFKIFKMILLEVMTVLTSALSAWVLVPTVLIPSLQGRELEVFHECQLLLDRGKLFKARKYTGDVLFSLHCIQLTRN